MRWYVGQLFWQLVIAFALGLLAGYLWWRWGWKQHVVTQEHEVSRLRRLADERGNDATKAEQELTDLRAKHEERMAAWSALDDAHDRLRGEHDKTVAAHAKLVGTHESTVTDLVV